MVAPIGRWRTQLLWRLFGLAIYELSMLHFTFVGSVNLFRAYQLEWGFAAGLIYLVGGARLITLLPGAVLCLAFGIPYLTSVVERQVPEEFAIILPIALMGVVLTFASITARAHPEGTAPAYLIHPDALSHRDVDRAHVSLFRIAGVLALGFASLHKLNWDFFDRDVSCATTLSAELAGYWRVPFSAALPNVSPMLIVAGEALAPALLLTYPRLGVVFSAVFVGIIGHRGATAFVLIVLACACAFVRDRDGLALTAAMKRSWPILLGIILVTAPLSAKTYIGPRTWYEFYVMQVVIVAVVLAMIPLLIADWKMLRAKSRAGQQRLSTGLLAPNRSACKLLPRTAVPRLVLVVFALCGLVSGFSPYLGWKYRMSFAMLSNLRVDDARWNSMLFPRWTYLRRTDPFVHVTELQAVPAATWQRLEVHPRKSTRGLYVGLFSPMSFKYRMRHAEFHRLQIDLKATYKGVAYEFTNALADPGFRAWVAALPDGKMFQQSLVATGPQPCVH